MRNAAKFWLENLKERDHLEDQVYEQVVVYIILKCILEKQGGKLWAGFIWLRTETSGGLL
jgi:hypothetical protein